MAKVSFNLKIIIRPFPDKASAKYEINLTADVTDLGLNTDKLAELAYNIEQVMNEHMPQIHVHSSIDVTDTERVIATNEQTGVQKESVQETVRELKDNSGE